jgi:hypothetical protein
MSKSLRYGLLLSAAVLALLVVWALSSSRERTHAPLSLGAEVPGESAAHGAELSAPQSDTVTTASRSAARSPAVASSTLAEPASLPSIRTVTIRGTVARASGASLERGSGATARVIMGAAALDVTASPLVAYRADASLIDQHGPGATGRVIAGAAARDFMRSALLAHSADAGAIDETEPSGSAAPPSGRFEASLRVPVPLVRRPARLALMIHGELALADLPEDLPDEIELGVILLAPPPELAHGRVADERGLPIANVTVKVRPRDEAQCRHERLLWPWPNATTDNAGTFSVRGWIQGEVVDLEAQTFDSANEPLFARGELQSVFATGELHGMSVGARNLLLVLRKLPTMSVAGRVLVDDPAMSAGLMLQLSSANRAWSCDVNAEGAFEFAAIACQPWNLQLRCKRTPLSGLLAGIETLAISTGSACTDVTLEPIDLRGKLHWLEARLQHADGSPYARAPVQAFEGDAWPAALHTDAEGRLRILYVSRAPQLEVRTPSGKRVPLTPGAVVRME